VGARLVKQGTGRIGWLEPEVSNSERGRFRADDDRIAGDDGAFAAAAEYFGEVGKRTFLRRPRFWLDDYVDGETSFTVARKRRFQAAGDYPA
jgi:hypothetical protein